MGYCKIRLIAVSPYPLCSSYNNINGQTMSNNVAIERKDLDPESKEKFDLKIEGIESLVWIIK